MGVLGGVVLTHASGTVTVGEPEIPQRRTMNTQQIACPALRLRITSAGRTPFRFFQGTEQSLSRGPACYV